MRQIILDTETTGMPAIDGHRIIEIGCVEMVNRELTGNTYHQYLNPNRAIDEGAFRVHGISEEFLSDKPSMGQVIDDFLAFVKGAELIIHNAPFDIGFLDYELKLLKRKERMIDLCEITDTVKMARKKFPGSRVNLDALTKRFNITSFNRDLHGALLDSEILARVYLMMTGGQEGLSFSASEAMNKKNRELATSSTQTTYSIPTVPLSDKESAEHDNILSSIKKE